MFTLESIKKRALCTRKSVVNITFLVCFTWPAGLPRIRKYIYIKFDKVSRVRFGLLLVCEIFTIGESLVFHDSEVRASTWALVTGLRRMN